MRDILFLAHRLPYPPDRGDRIRSWHVLNALAKLAPVHVAALVDDEPDPRHETRLAEVAASVTVEMRDTARLPAIFRALARNTPASVEAFRNAALGRRVGALLATHGIGCIYALSSQMAAYVPPDFAGRFAMDFVDMDSAKFAAFGGFANAQEAKRLLEWEIAAAKRADVSLFVSEAEAALFRKATGLPSQVLENGIDLARFHPGAVMPESAPHPLIVFTGQMDYPPNVEAVVDFARSTLPQLEATFAIVGRAPASQVRALASDRVIVTGEVADTRPWLAAADVVVAPLKLARGVQNKILEAMAMGRPVVTSRAAATGIDVQDGRDLIVADDPVNPIRMLLADTDRNAAMGRAARARMEARYAWDTVLAPLATLVAPAKVGAHRS